MDHYFTNNENLESKIKEIKYNVLDNSFIFKTDIGVFSKDRVDVGSDLLICTYLKHHNKKLNILDVGSGYGVIGITLSKITNSHVDMIDVNKRSVHLTKMNIKSTECDADAFYSDAYNEVNKMYDVVITNPPIRVGKTKLLEILLGAKDHLNDNGELWFVIRKDQGALSIIKILESDYKIDIIEKKKGYFIIKGKKNI